jgi:hypothetical protein
MHQTTRNPLPLFLFVAVFFSMSTLTAQVTVDAGPDTTIIQGQIVTLQGSVSYPPDGKTYCYIWSPAASLSNPTLLNPNARPDSTTTYTLTVKDDKGNVAGSDMVTITVQPIHLLFFSLPCAVQNGTPTKDVAIVTTTGGFPLDSLVFDPDTIFVSHAELINNLGKKNLNVTASDGTVILSNNTTVVDSTLKVIMSVNPANGKICVILQFGQYASGWLDPADFCIDYLDDVRQILKWVIIILSRGAAPGVEVEYLIPFPLNGNVELYWKACPFPDCAYLTGEVNIDFEAYQAGGKIGLSKIMGPYAIVGMLAGIKMTTDVSIAMNHNFIRDCGNAIDFCFGPHADFTLGLEGSAPFIVTAGIEGGANAELNFCFRDDGTRDGWAVATAGPVSIYLERKLPFTSITAKIRKKLINQVTKTTRIY